MSKDMDVKVEKLSDEDLESVAGGAAGDSNVSTACCSVNSTSCCDVEVGDDQPGRDTTIA